MNRLDYDYLDICKVILDYGYVKDDRTGTGTKSIFGEQIRHKMSDGFPLLTTKKMSLKNIATELRWFLNGDTNIKFLVDRGCNIWNGDTYKRYKNSPLEMMPDRHKFDNGESFIHFTEEQFIKKIKSSDEFSNIWGNLGPIYGKQWRSWEQPAWEDTPYGEYFPNHIDQIQNAIDTLKNNPDSRRIMVNAWNVSDIDDAVLPPCHYGFQFYTRKLTIEEREEWMSQKGYGYPYTPQREEQFKEYNVPERAISLMWNQRSVDTALGLPYNIASYGLLLTMMGNEVNMVPEDLIGNLGDTHLYLNHLEPIQEQMGRELTDEEKMVFFQYTDEQIENWRKKPMPFISKRTREPFDLPKLEMSGGIDSPLDGTDFKLIDYVSHPAINFPLSN